jgi:outer membrane lipoprotein-sorting protein
MKKLPFVTVVLIVVCTAGNLFALSALEIAQKGDAVVNAPKDAHILMTMILRDKNGNENKRTSEIYQMGNQKRLIRFLSPADQRGIGFLALPSDIMYLYLPAYHKIRQIAAHVKNQNFAGTDITYEDLSEFELAKAHSVEKIGEDNKTYTLKLTPADTKGKDYAYLVVHYRKDNFYPVLVEYFNSSGTLIKTIKRTDIVKVKGYWVAKKLIATNLRTNHSTMSIMDKIEFDVGLTDKIFTKRYLMRLR